MTIHEFNKWYEEGVHLSLKDIYIKLNLNIEEQKILAFYCKEVPDMEKIIRSKYTRQSFPDNFAKGLSKKLIVFDSIEKIEFKKKISYLKKNFKIIILFPTKHRKVIQGPFMVLSH